MRRRLKRVKNDLDIDTLSQEEIQSAKGVINIERSDREGETLSEAFVNRIRENMDIGDTGYTREVLFPIPLKLVEDSESTRNFIKKVGEISRSKNFNLPITMENETVEDVEIMNLVIKPTTKTDIQSIEEYLLN